VDSTRWLTHRQIDWPALADHGGANPPAGIMAQASHTTGGEVTADDLEVGMYVQLGPWKTQIHDIRELTVDVEGNIGGVVSNRVRITKDYAADHLITFGGGR